MPHENLVTTLYPIHTEKHIVKLYSNAFDEITKTSGTLPAIQKAIESATSFICIASWNNYLTKDLGMRKSLMDLLLDAAQRGVKVFILTWQRGVNNKFVGDSGIEDNLKYLLAHKNPNIFYKQAIRKGSLVENKIYSHHQKIFMTEDVAFVGGMDFVPKTTDTREHILDGKMWHDATCSAQGPVVLDILKMFYARWCAQLKKSMLFNNDAIASRILYAKVRALTNENISESKECDSSIQFLVSLKKQDYFIPGQPWPLTAPVTKEIHAAYLECIKNANKYLVITNQDFIGNSKTHHTSRNYIPEALIMRISQAHQKKEPFHIYLILPAVPGKDLTTLKPKTILRKDWETLDFLFARINEVTNNNAANYITVVELGQAKEKMLKHHKELSYKQVYVHAKFIFSENDLIIGSANLNERSLSGDRDSESVLRIKGYSAEISDFRNRLIEEYFGTKTFDTLNDNNLLNNLGYESARKIIDTYIADRLKLLPGALSFNAKVVYAPFELHDKKVSPLVSSTSSITSSLSHLDTPKEFKENQITFDDSSNPKVCVSTKELLPGCALPWGLIPKERLLRGEKPPRVPKSLPIQSKVCEFLGGSKVFR
jgi:phosphatidylserine/phosphatidylglycerophosphate/cardiolipin synthase-like enzyme